MSIEGSRPTRGEFIRPEHVGLGLEAIDELHRAVVELRQRALPHMQKHSIEHIEEKHGHQIVSRADYQAAMFFWSRIRDEGMMISTNESLVIDERKEGYLRVLSKEFTIDTHDDRKMNTSYADYLIPYDFSALYYRNSSDGPHFEYDEHDGTISIFEIDDEAPILIEQDGMSLDELGPLEIADTLFAINDLQETLRQMDYMSVIEIHPDTDDNGTLEA